MRGNLRDASTRLVIEGKKAHSYRAAQTGNKIVLQFNDPVNLSVADDSVAHLPRIAGIKILTPQSVEIDVADGQMVNHFTAANKVIVDIKGKITATSSTKAGGSESKPAIKSPPVEKKADATAPEAKPAAPEKLPANIIVSKAEEAPAKTDETAKEPAAPAPTPVTINITSVSALPIAVFRRGGYVWVIEDRESAMVPPTIDGLKDAAFEVVPVKNLSVFRVRLPENINLVASGGGLVWKISSDPALAKDTKPLQIVSRFGEAAKSGPELFWPSASAHRIVDLPDPDTGDIIHAVFTTEAKDYSGPAQNYAQVQVLPSIVGMAFIAKTDDVTATKEPDGIIITRPDGLALSPDRDTLGEKMAAAKEGEVKTAQTPQRIFDFEKWRIGDKKAIPDNQRIIMSGLAQQTDVKRAENLITLGHMMLAFNYAPEAMGYFAFAHQSLPDLDSSPEFRAAEAVAQILAGRSKEAFATLSTSQLSDIEEIKYWKAYALAELDDWQQAAATLPSGTDILTTYPPEIRNPIGLKMAEIYLRQGNPDKAHEILEILGKDKKSMPLGWKSAYEYLGGEYSRQKGKLDNAKEAWKKLVSGADDLYRAKARFALSTLQYDTKDITIDKAIDDLEGLRYAWRGDDLETSINYNLAKLYLQKNEPIKALTMMKLAAALTPESEQGKVINATLRKTFADLFTPDKIKGLTPIDAMTVYNEFSDLLPKGPEGDKLSRQLAERLVDADLLPRAQKLLQAQVDGNLQGVEGADVAIRLASLQVLDGKGEKAVATLAKADEFLKGAATEFATPRQHDIGMLRAKALSMMNKPQEAFETLALLPQDESVLKLRADIAWRVKRWQDAADSLEQILAKQDISLTRPLTDEQSNMILNWAVALYLADNRYVLANLRERYGDSMAATPYAKKFEVITRPRQSALLADRGTIESIINETTIFKDFLSVFKPDASKPVPSAAAPVNPPRGEGTAAPATNVPEELKNAPLLKTDDFKGD